MFDKKQFIHWADAARKDNTDMRDYNNSVRNPSKQLSETQQIDEIAPLVIGGLIAGAGALGYGAYKMGQSKGRSQAAMQGPAGGYGSEWNRLQKEREALNKETSGVLPSTIDRHSDAYQERGQEDNEGEEEKMSELGKYATMAKKRAMANKVKESIELDEGIIGGIAKGFKKLPMAGKVAVGAGLAAGAGSVAKKIASRAGERRDRNRELGQYGGGGGNPLSGRESRARSKADRTARRQKAIAKDRKELDFRQSKLDYQSEGIVGTMAKGAMGGLAAYGAYKGVQALRNRKSSGSSSSSGSWGDKIGKVAGAVHRGGTALAGAGERRGGASGALMKGVGIAAGRLGKRFATSRPS